MMALPDARTLQMFVAVAREGNATRAAERLHLSQPAVSLQLKRLGQESGMPLFRRTARGLELTAAGAILLGKAEQALAALAEFSGTARRLTKGVSGTLRIGTIIDPEFIRLGAFLKALLDSGATVATELRQGMSGEVLVAVKSGTLDAGFYLGEVAPAASRSDSPFGPAEPLLYRRRLAALRYRVVAPPSLERLVEARDWASLAELPWIGTPPASVHNRLLATVFAEAGVKQNVVALVDQEASMLEMARTGIGLCLCREEVALRARQAHGLAIADNVAIDTELSFVCLQARLDEPVISLALDVIDDIWSAG